MHTIEQAAFAAWPALEQQDFGGWRLRFSEGYTKRANSANALVRITSLPETQIKHIEAIFHARKLKPIFRLASFCTSPEVDQSLEKQGYQFADLSLVMTVNLAESRINDMGDDAHEQDFLIEVKPWLSAFQELSGYEAVGQKIHLRMLQAIQGQCAFAVLREGGQIVCCGLGVITGTQLGLFDVVTHPDFRGRGLAQQLCSKLMAWGKSGGASDAYLQVVATNATAIRVYEKLGFSRCYHYWYRLHP
ncbi:GNAT family N-acetyltransferase [Undibacterium sp. RTI2.1]|uniref:GNAT family N-acetyltransferase n=1 Tax=unclassified Undibacterium TaxID=2630295 RepID=UPI002AB5111D|nr:MULTISPECIES: GNAT family N-acetyltransferase [unclassified Undibacterium]MDY7538281.1 GNAT family N-acetyltransferase [Undibacterium sp. 5I1]MEB0030928.1 GNAT family N-acetyltransferase [Undibacterium sp. RTI2.1]MEB0117394.1 GNAT family N-acetyltransferase [Undibacterium sp. RTI2.2]MEB0229446.1 GNAT family N-acetyltransferase [Undibacterium sp. 10I3]MEB0256056.1 GNAT family N-acetyltransferase [Undibacterium sp. 5I1]